MSQNYELLGSSSSSSSGDESDADYGFVGFRAAKRQKTGKEDAMLGVFGDDDEGDGSQRITSKPVRYRGVSFSKHSADDENQPQDKDILPDEFPDYDSLGNLQRRGIGGEASESTPPQDDQDSGESHFGLGAPRVAEKIEEQEFMPQPVTSDEPKRVSFMHLRQQPKQEGKVSSKKTSQYGLGAKLMAKMGYVEGQGLGVHGSGILNPIEQKVRARNLGLGGQRERTKQSIQEAKRRGDSAEPDEEEEDELVDKGGNLRPKTKRAPQRKKPPKPIYKTVEEMENDGLPVPERLKELLIDMTSGTPQIVETPHGFIQQQQAQDNAQESNENVKVAEMARTDLEMYAKEWRSLKQRQDYTGLQESRLTQVIDEEYTEIERLKGVVDLVSQLEKISLQQGDKDLTIKTQTEGILDQLQAEYPEELETLSLDKVAVAGLFPLLKQYIADWSPLDQPTSLLDSFLRYRKLLRIKPSSRDMNKQSASRRRRRRHRGSIFDTLMSELWLPKVRSSLNNSWSIRDPNRALLLLEEWRDIIPAFVETALIQQVLVPKLHAGVEAWKPLGGTEGHRHNSRQKRTSSEAIDWLLPWFGYLSSENIHTIAILVQQKYTRALKTWRPDGKDPLKDKAFIEGLDKWREILSKDLLDEMILKNLVPRLAERLRNHLVIDPSNQETKELEGVVAWEPLMKPSIMSHLLVTEFFPAWLTTLHQWLQSDEADFGEIKEWYESWKTWFPKSVSGLEPVRNEFLKGLEMINQALDLKTSQAIREKLRPPAVAAGPRKPINMLGSTGKKSKAQTSSSKPTPTAPPPDITFKDIVQDYCLEHNLVFMPLRRAHEQSGNQLYRISASASGAGGVTGFIDGDILWVKKGGANAAGDYMPMSLDDLSSVT